MAMKNVTPAVEAARIANSRANRDPNRPTRREGDAKRARNGLHVIDSRTDTQINAEIEENLEQQGRRKQYMPMRLHMEKAAMALAAGYSQKKAAEYAGVHPRQLRKYMQSNDFRERIVEHRQIVMSKIQGQIIREVEKRVGPGKIDTLEPLDLVRFYNMTTGGKDKGLGDGVTVNIKYDQIFNTIAATIQAADAEGEGGDFPEYGPEDLLLPGGDSSGD